MAAATRLIAISDLHLGGVAPYMMSNPERLAAFIDSLPGRLAADETLELVIAGDFIDFLAVPDFKSWTPDPREASAKLGHTLRGPFASVFDALRRHVAGGHRLTLLIGNHDIDLALPAVKDALLREIGAGPPQVNLLDFVCLEAKLVIEVDGGQHVQQVDRDARRTAWLEQRGWVQIFFNDDGSIG